jgi:hypothetical protein
MNLRISILFPFLVAQNGFFSQNIRCWIFMAVLTALSLLTILLFILYPFFVKNKRAKPRLIQFPARNRQEGVMIKPFTARKGDSTEPTIETIPSASSNAGNFENISPESESEGKG